MISVIILTKNEQEHIERCILNASLFSSDIHIVDSFSNDRTIEYARKYKVNIVQNEFRSQSQQFNWALENLPLQLGAWIFRIDADEYIQDPHKVKGILDSAERYDGVSCKRNIVFMNKKLRYGQLGNQRVVRIFKFGKASCEDKIMDEHIVVRGQILSSSINIIDHCTKGLDFWFKKHLSYADREAIMSDENFGIMGIGRHASMMRIGKVAYNKLPKILSIPLYFLFRYVICLGFLDGKPGFWYLWFQVIWYRSLVELKKRIKQ